MGNEGRGDRPGRMQCFPGWARREDTRFDRLVLATGAHPFMPPTPVWIPVDCGTLRTREDAETILEHAQRGDPVVIVGGGVLGLETAGARARRGVSVTILEGHEWLMPRQLDREAGSRGRGTWHRWGSGSMNAKTKEIEGTGAPRRP